MADRENGRIQCFDLNLRFLRQIRHKEFHGRLFAVAYSSKNGQYRGHLLGNPLTPKALKYFWINHQDQGFLLPPVGEGGF